MRKRIELGNICFTLIVLYVFLFQTYQQTVFYNPILGRIIVWAVFFASVFLFFETVSTSRGGSHVFVFLWTPFLLYTIFSYVLKISQQSTIHWAACFLLLFAGRSKRLTSYFPYKLVIFLGVLSIAGMVVQILFRSFHHNYIASIFSNPSKIISWEKSYEFAGFTYQLDTTGIQILFSLFAFLCFKKHKNKVASIAIIIIYLSFILLNGKRIFAFIAIVAPLALWLLISEKKKYKTILIYVGIPLVTIFLLYFYFNAESLSSLPFVGRLADTIVKIGSGDDFSNLRGELSQMAINAFNNSNKMFGIGVGNFISVSGASTSVHNSYLQVLCEQGIIGEILFIAPLILSLAYTLKIMEIDNRNKFVHFSFVTQLYFIIYAFTGNPTINAFGFVMYFISLSAMTPNVYSKKRNESSKEVFRDLTYDKKVCC